MNIVEGTSYTKFHDSRFRHSSNVKVITSTATEDAALVLLMEGIYESCRWHGLGWHDIHTKFHKVRFKFSKIFRGDAHIQKGDLISLLLYFQNKERKLNICSETFVLSSDWLYENTINYLRNEQDLSQTSVVSAHYINKIIVQLKVDFSNFQKVRVLRAYLKKNNTTLNRLLCKMHEYFNYSLWWTIHKNNMESYHVICAEIMQTSVQILWCGYIRQTNKWTHTNIHTYMHAYICTYTYISVFIILQKHFSWI
jgi:hypothetical protein